MPRILGRSLLLLSISILMTRFAASQDLTGLPPFSAIHAGVYDNVKIADGGVLLTLPVRSKAGLIPFRSALSLNNSVGLCCSVILDPSWAGVVSSGIIDSPSNVVGSVRRNSAVAATSVQVDCPDHTLTTKRTNWSFFDALGTAHPIWGIVTDSKNCLSGNRSAWTADASGYYVTVTGSQVVSGVTYTDVFGNTVNTNGGTTLSDANGNGVIQSYSETV